MESAHGPFTDVVKKWSMDAITVRPSSIKDVLYHYTDAAGLFGMLNSGEIWLTDYRFLNDKAEFSHALTIVDSAKKTMTTTKGLNKAFLPVLKNAGLPDLRGSDGALFSLSEEKDDLSQWRGYAKDGMGFTIGFDGAAIHNRADASDSGFVFAKVNYDNADEELTYGKILNAIYSIFQVKIKESPESHDDLIGFAIEAFDYICLNRALLSKHASFKAENEWRMVTYMDEADDVSIRVSGRNLIPYSALKLGGLLPIKEIGIGPGFSGSQITDAVKTLAKNAGYSPEIYFADTPYRRGPV